MIEFALNAETFSFTKLFVFMINYEFESRMNFDSADADDTAQDRLLIRERILSQKAKTIIEKMKNIWNFTKQKLIKAQDIQKHYANRKRNISSEYVIKDEVWLFTKNMKTKRSFKKLNHKWIESYKSRKY
jgi:hypothetical protein